MTPPGAQERRASYSEGAAFGALSFGIMGALGIVTGVVIARLYGIEVLGEYALVMAPVNAVWYLSSARERPAFVRELATLDRQAPRVTGLFAAMLAFSFALTLTVAALGLLATYFIFKGPVGQPDLFVPAAASMGAYLVITNTAWNLDAVFSGFRAGRELFWIRSHQTIIFLVIAIAGGVALDSVWGLVLATAGSAVTSLVHRVIAVRPFMRPRVARSEVRAGFRTLPDLIRFGLKIAPGSIATGISNETATWVLGIVGSVAAVGAYSRAWTLGRRFVELSWRITEMLFPTLVERRAGADRPGFDRALVDTVRYCAAGLLLPAAVGGGAAVGVMDVFGPGFRQAADALAVILLMPALLTVDNVLRNALFAVDRPGLSSWISIGRMIVTVVLTIALTLWLGVTGAALGLLAGGVAELCWMGWVIRRHLVTPPRDLWPLRQLPALIGAYASGFAAARAVDSALASLAGVLPALVAGTLTYAIVFWAAGGLGPRDRVRLRALTARLRARLGRPARGAKSSYGT